MRTLRAGAAHRSRSAPLQSGSWEDTGPQSPTHTPPENCQPESDKPGPSKGHLPAKESPQVPWYKYEPHSHLHVGKSPSHTLELLLLVCEQKAGQGITEEAPKP